MHSAITAAAITFIVIANILTYSLYSYPLILGCSFPAPGARGSHVDSDQLAPFRLLVFGDPQLEGDSSLPDVHNGYSPTLQEIFVSTNTSWTFPLDLLLAWQIYIKNSVSHDVPRLVRLYRKKLDLLGNDYYLAHIYRTLYHYVQPTHVAVLGDLIGSQWVSEKEFRERGRRYWNRVFRNGFRVEDEVTCDQSAPTLCQSDAWKRRVINIVGNHDIGYAGDISIENMQRFERTYGKANWATRFTLLMPGSSNMELPELKLVVLNSLNMDAPALDYGLQTDTYRFINDIIAEAKPVEDTTSATVLLTHLPLHKEAGICVDGPMINYYDSDRGGTVREQNHLSPHASKAILEGVFGKSTQPEAPAGGLGRNGIILTGHDHEGCDVYHHILQDDKTDESFWRAERTNASTLSRLSGVPGIREITVRSMMGDFGGNAGLLSAWFDSNLNKWHFEYDTCALGVQHIWWAIHIFDIITLIFATIVGWRLVRPTKVAARTVSKKEKTV